MTSNQTSPPSGGGGPVDEVLGRLRARVGVFGDQAADDLVEAMRHELARQYERGYHDGWASFREPALQERPRNGLQRAGRRMRRRARRGLRALLQNPGRLRRLFAQIVLIAVASWAAAEVTIRINNESHNQKWAPPVIPK